MCNSLHVSLARKAKGPKCQDNYYIIIGVHAALHARESFSVCALVTSVHSQQKSGTAFQLQLHYHSLNHLPCRSEVLYVYMLLQYVSHLELASTKSHYDLHNRQQVC